MDRDAKDTGFDWARRFNEDAIAIATSTPENAASLTRHDGFRMVAPTPEHFLPFLYIAGFGARTKQTLDVLVDGYAYGSLSMTSFVVGMECPDKVRDPGGAAPLGTSAPPEDANI
jgi:4,5-DOPA dioxygenase extradiol